jgi:hydroxymethylbilane synthase
LKLIIGSRGSDLALAQSRYIAGRMAALPAAPEIEIRIIHTSGDRILDVPLSEVNRASGVDAKGVFTKEIEDALLAKEIDLAVHSYKDLPSVLPTGLMIGAIPQRVDARDALIFPKNKLARDAAPFVAPGSVVATSSVRRTALVRHLWPDLKLADLRGNVPTRLRKLFAPGGPDAILLAEAGVLRLKAAGFFDQTAEDRALLDSLELRSLPPELFPSAPAQGALAIECRAGDERLLALLRQLHDTEAAICVDAERRILAALDGGCFLPLGAAVRPDAERGFALSAFLGPEAVDNRRKRARHFERSARTPEALTERCIREIKQDLPLVLTGRQDRLAELLAANPGRSLLALPLLATHAIYHEAPALHAQIREWLSGIDATSLCAAFSSPGVDSFADFLDALKLPPPNCSWAATGERTAESIRRRFPDVRLVALSPDNTGAGLAARLLEHSPTPTRILGLSAERGRDEFYERMTQAGVRVLRLALYRTEALPPARESLAALPEHCIVVLGSPRAAETYFAALADASLPDGDGRLYCAIGPTTEDAIRRAGRDVYIRAREADYQLLIEELA